MKVDIRTILRQMMAVYNVEVTEIAYPYNQIIKHDCLELRKNLAMEVKVDEKTLLKYLKSLSMNGVTLIEDVIGISFVLFLLPDTRNCIIVGPYRTKEFSQVVDKLHLTANQAHTLKEMLMLIPEVSEDLIVKIPRAMRVVIEVLLIKKQTSFDIMKLAWQLTTK